MTDDPLVLILYAVTAMAGGMYPLGFLFGACSACCDECPEVCSRCTHYAHNGNQCNDYFYGAGRSVTVSVAGQGTSTLASPPMEPGELLLIPITGSPVPQGRIPFGTPGLTIGIIDGIQTQDACACAVCQAVIPITISFPYENDSYVIVQANATLPFDACADTTATANVSGLFVVLDKRPSSVNVNELLLWVNALSVSVSLTIPGCDCGACCDSNCEEEVAEGGCAAWQGVGVDCDPDPCV